MRVNHLIVRELGRIFPHDAIMSEETSPQMPPFEGRTWVIDPICGTSNASRGISIFSTNVSLVEKNKVVAAWVADHLLKRIIWSLGNEKVYINKKSEQPLLRRSDFTTFNMDTGYLYRLSKDIRVRFVDFMREVILDGNSHVCSFNSSLAFAYVASGQIQSSITINVFAWDIFAACFLIEQNGGLVTHYDGTPWTLKSKSVLMSSEKNIHQYLLDILKKHHLEKIK